MKNLKKKKIFIFLGFLLLLIIIVIASLSNRVEKIKVQTEKVTRGRITASVSGSAKAQPDIQVKISAKVSGQIMNLGVKEGDHVKKGQFLIQLDPEFYEAVVEQNQSNLNYALAGHEKTKNEYERTQKLFSDNLLSQAELDIAKSTFEQSKSQVAQNKAALKQARDNLSKTTLYSPMEGVVSQLNKKIGEMAMGSQFTLDVIMVIADLTSMLAETEIDENDIVSVSVNDTAKITIDAFPDTSFQGIVKEIANTGAIEGLGTQDEVTNFLVKVSMLEKPDRIRPGMSATVDIITESKDNVLKTPIQCITERKPLPSKIEKKKDKRKSSETKDTIKNEYNSVLRGKNENGYNEKPVKVVFIVKNNIVHQTSIITGISSDTEWEIKAGVKENEEIVSGSYRVLSKQLKDGDRVKVDNTFKKNLRNK
jgi:HlyD family secretion protein